MAEHLLPGFPAVTGPPPNVEHVAVVPAPAVPETEHEALLLVVPLDVVQPALHAWCWPTKVVQFTVFAPAVAEQLFPVIVIPFALQEELPTPCCDPPGVG